MGAPKTGKTREERDAFGEKIKALIATGLKHREVADKLGIRPATVGYYATARDHRKGQRKRNKHKTALKHRTNGHIVSVLGGPTDSGTEATGFAAGFISGWLGSYAMKHGLDATGLTVDVVDILRKEVR